MPNGQPLTAVWLFDSSASAYVDNTIESASDGGTAFEIMAEANDRLYFGFSRRIDALMWVLGTPGGHGVLTWEYGVSITSWIPFAPVHDGGFGVSPEYMQWTHLLSATETPWVSFAFDDVSPHPQTPPDTTSRFWIRVSAASVTTPSTVTSLVCRPYVTYATPEDVQKQLQLTIPFSATSNPDIFMIEDMIRGVEDMMVYTMGEAWRVEFVENEDLDFNQYGIKMRYQPISQMYKLEVWNGSAYDTKVEGRDQDFHVIDRIGNIYISTIFLDAVPPTMRRSYSARREQGAFKRAVRVNYSHGHQFGVHLLSMRLRRIATLKACMDVVSDLDWAPLIPLGMDTINLQTKWNNWEKEVDSFLGQFAKTRIA